MLEFSPQLRVVYRNGVAVVYFPATDMSEETALALGRQLYALAGTPRTCRFLIDLAAVSCLSSAVLGKVIGLYKMARQRGGGLAICSARPDVAARLVSMRLDKLFPIYPTEAEALADWCALRSLVPVG
ncbi:MAG TPA: STAS domain-containing protein [Gemmataceae bacterium]|nr:STAS domain-containing protein [Gemmataceae bacterium]